jgi:hypothetical protein
LSALVLPQDAYIVELGKQRLAAMAPANRQAVVRWLRESINRSEPALSPYLTAAVQSAAEKIDIVEALDMTDAIPRRRHPRKTERLQRSEQRQAQGRRRSKLTSLLASLKGVIV